VTLLRWWPVGFCLTLAVLTACGIKGDPVPPEPRTDPPHREAGF
jgi:predicted small lipoprotein YifL